MTKRSMEGNVPGKMEVCDPTDVAFPIRRSQSSIQWPTEAEIQEISTRLVEIGRVGIRLEDSGDFFKSGDLAYGIQEIIRATAELSKKAQRTKE